MCETGRGQHMAHMHDDDDDDDDGVLVNAILVLTIFPKHLNLLQVRGI